MLPTLVAQQVEEALLDYLDTTFGFSDAAFREALFAFLRDREQGLFRGPYVDVRLPYKKATAEDAIPLDLELPYPPYLHQLRAYERLTTKDGHAPTSTLVVTGTGSGKTECFLHPVLDHCARHAGEPGVKAILLYPMNALASDQARRLAALLAEHPRLKGRVTAGLYVGGKGTKKTAGPTHLVDDREILRSAPPDILLTNYKMLDFLLLRPQDAPLWAGNGPETLRYVVLDELHTYDGAQGSDVACLLRRLKARLGIRPGTLACVGTSATIGSKGKESSRLLREFAAKVFGEVFDEESVVEELRYEQHELFALLGPTTPVIERVPTQAELAALDPQAHDDPSAYLAKAAEAWLGTSPSDRVELGRLLARSRTLHRTLLSLISGIDRIEHLATEVADIDRHGLGRIASPLRPRALAALLALVAHARRRDGSTIVPFLPTQTQLWMRELRRLRRRVSPHVDASSFVWSDDAGALLDGNYLPIAHCRECGGSGFAAVEKDAGGALEGAPAIVGDAYQEKKRTARYIIPRICGDGPEQYLCPGCLRLGAQARCPCGDKPIRVTVARERTNANGKKVFSEECPECGARGALSLLGARAASLSTVAVANLFLTPFNEDKKLLAFTDSVQDASHLAGFFGSRAYRFNLRTAIQTVLEASNGAVPLPAIAPKMVATFAERLAVPKMVATFLPPDLADLDEARVFLEKPKSALPEPLRQKLTDRLGWEVTMELGYSAGFGRTLENSGCATAYVDTDRMERAAHSLALDLAEEATLGSVRPADATVRTFLEAFVDRVRRRGGVCHPFLDPYVQADGKSWALQKRRNPLMSPFPEGAIGFRFLISSPHDRFDSYVTDPKGTVAWTRDWAARVFGLDRGSPAINLLYAKTVQRLVGAGILREVPVGSARVAGLVPEALLATTEVAHLGCATCRRDVVIAAATAPLRDGQACPSYRCDGVLARKVTPPRSYYARRYGSGRLERVFSEEHTGLLGRETRENLENRFKEGTAADAPNLLVCTPTLEMGIDIGDLSATLMCRTPPSASSYLQRVGRAGRRTGNAFILSVAHARPHDMAFFADPRAMMAGTVTPPGCFLDAPEILKRQLIAHALDAWAEQASAKEDAIPGAMRDLVGAVNRRQFPGKFLDFYEANHELLLARFFAMFDPYVGEGTRARLRELATPAAVRKRVEDAFRFVEEELEVIRSEVNKAGERLREIEGDPRSSADPDVEREELEHAKRVADRMLDDIYGKYPLNVLTDAGVLPNYAFPEPGVTLRSAVRFRAKKGAGGKGEIQTYEYLRPASAAIRELAPFNSFYAEGRRVVVTQIDLGTTQTPLTETWRFCRACSHVERENAERPEPTCPSCDDAGWSDVGQLRRVVHFKRSLAMSDAVTSATTDETEDRVRERYETLDLIEVRPDNVQGARVIEALPFGIEMLTRVRLREVNFGRAGQPSKMSIGGTPEVSAAGFVVCKDCGRVEQDQPVPGSASRIDHHPTCAYRKGKRKEERTDAVFLYREIQSEALRILLPVSAVSVENERASFQAALLLGLRRKFHGTPSHLALKTMSEPVAGSSMARRVFLVLYDTVPGGTGYLAELWKEGTFFEVLQLALDALKTCRCRNDPKRDGCYGCLFAYSVQRDIPNISAQRAIRQLTEILDNAASLRPTHMLSEVSLDTRLESELERRFLASLLDWAAKDGWTASATMTNGAEAHVLRKDGRAWLVEAQVDLDVRHGVTVASRPDFVLTPIAGMTEARPLAVFCDGFAFHVMPAEPRARVEDDVRKRRAIVESGKYWTMAVTWKDIEEFEAREPTTKSLFAAVSRPMRGRPFVDQAERRSPPAHDLPENLHLRNGFALVTEYLGAPDAALWRRAVLGLLAIAATQSKQTYASEGVRAVRDTLTRSPDRCGADLPPTSPKGDTFAWSEQMPSAAVLVHGRKERIAARDLTDIQVALRLFDEPGRRAGTDFEPSWRAFLQAFSLLQFHAAVQVTTSEVIAYAPRRESEPAPASTPPRADAGYAQAMELTDADLHPLLRACAEAGAPAPEVGIDIQAGGRVIATGELAWPRERVVVLIAPTERELAALLKAGWRALSTEAPATEVVAALRDAAREVRKA